MKKYDIILCECQCSEHQIIFNYDDDPNWENIYISYHLQKLPFWRRVDNAIKYIFGKKSRYGHFGELILEPDDDTIKKFQHIVDRLKIMQKNIKNREHDIYVN